MTLARSRTVSLTHQAQILTHSAHQRPLGQCERMEAGVSEFRLRSLKHAIHRLQGFHALAGALLASNQLGSQFQPNSIAILTSSSPADE